MPALMTGNGRMGPRWSLSSGRASRGPVGGDDNGKLLSPDLFGEFHDHAQLRPLLVLGEHIAFLGRCEFALRRQTELVERNIFRGFIDAPLDVVFRLEAAALGGDEP